MNRVGGLSRINFFLHFCFAILTATTLSSCAKIRSYHAESESLVATVPQVVQVSALKETGIYKAGTLIPIEVEFTEEVAVKGSPGLELNVIPQTLVLFGAGSWNGNRKLC